MVPAARNGALQGRITAGWHKALWDRTSWGKGFWGVYEGGKAPFGRAQRDCPAQRSGNRALKRIRPAWPGTVRSTVISTHRLAYPGQGCGQGYEVNPRYYDTPQIKVTERYPDTSEQEPTRDTNYRKPTGAV